MHKNVSSKRENHDFRDQISYSQDVVNQSRPPSLQTPHPNAKSREKAMKTLTAITFRREELNQSRTTAVEGTGKCTEIIIIS